MTVITREMKESLIERILSNASFWLNGTSPVKALTEMMHVQNFLIRNINYHASFNKIDVYTCYDDTDLNNLCIALQKIAETIETDKETKIFENVRGYTFGDFERQGVIEVYQKDKIVYAKTIQQDLTPEERDKLTNSIKYLLWIIGNWKQVNRII